MLEILWSESECSAETVRLPLGSERKLSDSAVRTVLRRLVDKGFAVYRRDGRRYLYRPAMAPEEALAVSIRHVLGRLSGSGAGDLAVGMVDSDMLSASELERLRERIEKAERRRKKHRG